MSLLDRGLRPTTSRRQPAPVDEATGSRCRTAASSLWPRTSSRRRPSPTQSVKCTRVSVATHRLASHRYPLAGRSHTVQFGAAERQLAATSRSATRRRRFPARIKRGQTQSQDDTTRPQSRSSSQEMAEVVRTVLSKDGARDGSSAFKNSLERGTPTCALCDASGGLLRGVTRSSWRGVCERGTGVFEGTGVRVGGDAQEQTRTAKVAVDRTEASPRRERGPGLFIERSSPPAIDADPTRPASTNARVRPPFVASAGLDTS